MFTRNLDIFLSPPPDGLLITDIQRLNYFPRRSDHERAGRHFHIPRHHGSCRDNAASPDPRSIHHDRAHANQDLIFDFAGMQKGLVPHCHIVSHSRAPIAGKMMAALIDYCEGGADHDAAPLQYTLPYIGRDIDVGFYSRKREINEESSFSVLG